MSTSDYIPSPKNLKVIHPASLLTPIQRQQIAVQAIAKTAKITELAKINGTSRKFIAQQKEKAENALQKTFEEDPSGVISDPILFYLPITKRWITQFAIALVLICRCSYQGVVEILRDLFDYEICKATVHNYVYKALDTARTCNQEQDLSRVDVGLHDEIYQAGDPVLAGVCAHSTYCYLLSLEESCDANTWGVHLLNLRQKQNLNPIKTLADGGGAARKGQSDAWPDTPCGGDTFHAFLPFGKLCSYLENRVNDAAKAFDDWNHKVSKPRGKWKDGEHRQQALHRMAAAENVLNQATALHADVKTLHQWLQNDILSLHGPSHRERYELIEYIVDELRVREDMCKHRIEPVRKYLENHKDNLLTFVLEMEDYFAQVAIEFEISLCDVRHIANLKKMNTQKRWEEYTRLRHCLKDKFHLVENAVHVILEYTMRATSLVENLNSRLRNYFTLRRHLGNDYLEILRFFLNHRRFMRSECNERIGKSPLELLTGQEHKHWLEILGFDLFKQAA
jgi:hypothetical protein